MINKYNLNQCYHNFLDIKPISFKVESSSVGARQAQIEKTYATLIELGDIRSELRQFFICC